MEKHGTTVPVILANGDFPSHKIPLSILKSADFLVCTDGSTASLLEYVRRNETDPCVRKIAPSVIVGDGDSIDVSLKSRFRDIYVEYEEQDYNDLTKATRYCIDKGYNHIVYLGIGGKREDHAIANFSLLMWYFRHFNIRVEAYTDYGRFIPCSGTYSLNVEPGIQVSVFNFGARKLKSCGLKWDIYDFDELWQGTLNEAVSDTVTVSAEGDYLLYITYEKKNAGL